MAFKKSEKRLLVMLGIVVVVFVINMLKSANKDKKTPSPQTPVSKNTSIAHDSDEPSANPVKLHIVAKHYEHWGRNPFMGKNYIRVDPDSVIRASLQLKGIIWKNNTVFVLINDHIIKEGEEKEGIHIEKVTGKQVICRKDGRKITLLWKG